MLNLVYKFFIVLLPILFSVQESGASPSLKKGCDTIYLYNNYLHVPISKYTTHWSTPKRSDNQITQVYTHYGKSIVAHYIFTEQGDTIQYNHFQKLERGIRGYNYQFRRILRRAKVKYMDSAGVNLINLDPQTIYYMLWPIDNTLSLYGYAKIVLWEYYFIEDVRPARSAKGTFISP